MRTTTARCSELRRRVGTWAGSFASNRRGSPALEFALIIAPLAALFIAILQTSLVFFAQQNLETAAEKSVRQLVTGQAQKGGTTAAQFKTLVCGKLPVFLKCANVLIDVRQSVGGFSSAGTSRPAVTVDSNGAITNTWQYSPGGPGSVNVVTIMYIWTVSKGPLGFDLSTMSSNRRLLYATSVFRTEPYT